MPIFNMRIKPVGEEEIGAFRSNMVPVLYLEFAQVDKELKAILAHPVVYWGEEGDPELEI